MIKTNRPRVLVLDDNLGFGESLARALRTAFVVVPCRTDDEARRCLDVDIQVAVVDIVLREGLEPCDRSGLEFLRWAVKHFPDIPLVVLTGHGADDVEIEALRIGAADYIEKERFNVKLLEAKMCALLERRALRDRARQLAAQLEEYEPHCLIGESDAIVTLRDEISQVGQTDSSVLIQGETGAGKEVVARAIHCASARSGKPFVAVNCAAVSGGVSESDLFGHERGAFTGAERRRIGVFEAADGGTLLLDEITEMAPDLQAKLLRVLQERKLQRVGGAPEKDIRVDVRLLATTNREPSSAVRLGKLRHDLFYRLNVVPITVPPLRAHVDDVRILAEHFLEQFRRRIPHAPLRFSDDAFAYMRAYAWPGNIRELQNLVERACALCRDEEIDLPLVRAWLGGSEEPGHQLAGASELDFGRAQARGALAAVARALELCSGAKDQARKVLGFQDRSTMRRNVAALRSAFPDIWAEFPQLSRCYGPARGRTP